MSSEKKYYFIDIRDHEGRAQYSDELWKYIAENNGEAYVLTEFEFQQVKDYEYLEMCEYRKI